MNMIINSRIQRASKVNTQKFCKWRWRCPTEQLSTSAGREKKRSRSHRNEESLMPSAFIKVGVRSPNASLVSIKLGTKNEVCILGTLKFLCCYLTC